jgi:hypothetical protein
MALIETLERINIFSLIVNLLLFLVLNLLLVLFPVVEIANTIDTINIK